MKKLIEGLTVEETIAKYERLVHKAVHAAKANTVCSYEDMFQEGLLAIVEAFDRFDENKNVSFSTYVYTYVNGRILDYQKKHLNILSGGHYLQAMLKKAGPDATDDDLRAMKLSEESIQAAKYFNQNYIPANYDELEFMVSEYGDPSDNISIGFFDWRKYLTEKQAFVIEKYFGFGCEPITQAEIARITKVSHKTVRETLKSALKKLKKVPGIEDYFYD